MTRFCLQHIALWWSCVPYYSKIPPCITKLGVRPMNKVYVTFTFWPINKVLVLLQIVLSRCSLTQLFFKSHHAWQSYGPDMNMFHWSPCKKFTVTLTFDLATWFLFATNRLVTMLICAKLISIPTMHDKVMGGTHIGVTKAYACMHKW